MTFEFSEFLFDLLDFDESATILVLGPSFRILTARTMLAATLSPQDRTQAWTIYNRVSLEIARQADVTVWDIALRRAKFIRIRCLHILILDEKTADCEYCGFSEFKVYSLPRATLAFAFLLSRLTLVSMSYWPTETLCFTRARSSAFLPSFQRSSEPTR